MEKEKKILENSSGHGCNDTKTANSGLRFDFFFKQKNRRVLFDARDQREDERFAGAEVALPAAVAVLGPALAPRRRTVGPKNLKIQLKNKKKTR